MPIEIVSTSPKLSTLQVITAIVAMGGLGACETPQNIRGPQPQSLISVAASPNIGKMDTGSFSEAVVFYPVAGTEEHHVVNVADYLIYRIMRTIPSKVRRVRLVRFSAHCAASGLFLPHAVCDAEMVLGIDEKEHINRVQGVDIGHLTVHSQPLYGDAGEPIIIQQTKYLIDTLTEEGS